MKLLTLCSKNQENALKASTTPQLLGPQSNSPLQDLSSLLKNKCAQEKYVEHNILKNQLDMDSHVPVAVYQQAEVTSTEIRPIPLFGLLKCLCNIDATG